MFETVSEIISKNEIMQGGALLIVWGALLAYCRHVPARFWSFISRQLIVKVDIPDSELAFDWINLWLAERSTLKGTRLLTAAVIRDDGTTAGHQERAPESAAPRKQRKTRRIVFSPAPGAHFFWYHGRVVLLQRTRRDLENSSGNRAFQETFVVRMFTRNRKLVSQLLEEARDLALPPDDTRIEIMEVEYDTWRHMTYRNPREPESVILPGNMVQDLLVDVQKFLGSRNWYDKRGIPYRRGYLLEGPPGSGKTSLVTAIATAIELNVCVLSLSSTHMSDDILRRLMGEMPAGSILLLEDIDALFKGRDMNRQNVKGLTFSGLLNAIDGIATKDGRILFMTTNHPENLDPALIRPGRVDRGYRLSWALPEQAEQLFLRFFHDVEVDFQEATGKEGLAMAAMAFGKKVAGLEISMAALQGYLLEYRSDPTGAVMDFEEKCRFEFVPQEEIDALPLQLSPEQSGTDDLDPSPKLDPSTKSVRSAKSRGWRSA